MATAHELKIPERPTSIHSCRNVEEKKQVRKAVIETPSCLLRTETSSEIRSGKVQQSDVNTRTYDDISIRKKNSIACSEGSLLPLQQLPQRIVVIV